MAELIRTTSLSISVLGKILCPIKLDNFYGQIERLRFLLDCLWMLCVSIPGMSTGDVKSWREILSTLPSFLVVLASMQLGLRLSELLVDSAGLTIGDNTDNES